MNTSESPSPTIELHFQLTPIDFMQASWAHLRTSGIAWFAIAFLGLFMFLAGIYRLITEPGHPLNFPVFFGPFVLIVLPLSVILSAHSTFKNQPSLAAQQMFRADSSGIAISGPLFTGTESWSVYLYYAESPHLFMLYIGPRLYRILPKRAFSSPEQLDQFRTLISQHLRPRGFRFSI